MVCLCGWVGFWCRQEFALASKGVEISGFVGDKLFEEFTEDELGKWIV